jgi:hypothetical protein
MHQLHPPAPKFFFGCANFLSRPLRPSGERAGSLEPGLAAHLSILALLPLLPNPLPQGRRVAHTSVEDSGGGISCCRRRPTRPRRTVPSQPHERSHLATAPNYSLPSSRVRFRCASPSLGTAVFAAATGPPPLANSARTVCPANPKPLQIGSVPKLAASSASLDPVNEEWRRRRMRARVAATACIAHSFSVLFDSPARHSGSRHQAMRGGAHQVFDACSQQPRMCSRFQRLQILRLVGLTNLTAHH